MSKKIFASGYFSMDRVVEMLVADGHEVYTAYPSSIEGTKFVDFGIVGITPEIMEAEGYNDFANFVLSNLTVGGKSVGSGSLAALSIAGWLIQAVHFRETIIRAMELLGDLDAVIVHNDYDPVYGAITLWAQRKGIPVFCLYNGFSSFLHPKHTSFLNFRMGSSYCMNGEYDLEYVNTRKIELINGILTGCPAWDDYYTVDKKRESNTFLYNITTNYEEMQTDANMSIVHPTALHPWTFHYRPATIDDTFFKAFAKYQKDVNPEAKLVITMRPYYILSTNYSKLSETYGIDNVTVCESYDRPFRELIQECEYFISGISTTIQEAVITRTPTVFLCGTEPADDFFKGRDCYVESVIKENAITEALHYVTSVKSELIEACDSRASYYNFGDDGKASERAFLHIREAIT